MTGFNPYPPQVKSNSKKKNKKKSKEATQKLVVEVSPCPDSIPGLVAYGPDTLKLFVSKCFNKCQTQTDFNMTSIILRSEITLAANNGTLWTKDWDKEAVPKYDRIFFCQYVSMSN